MAVKTRSSNRGNTEHVRYQLPMGLTPWAKGAGVKGDSGTVWISMKPKRIIDQYSKGAGTYGTVDLNTEFLFLAPPALSENIIHHWDAYESVASRLAQKARSAIKLANETTALGRVFAETLSVENIKKTLNGALENEGTSVESAAKAAYNAVPGSKIPAIKIDTPLYYTNSDRRQIVFEFQLFNENINGWKSEDILMKPIQELMKMSSPDLISDITIEFPYMWEITTKPTEFIKYSYCALTAVQPTWNAPYINHLPASCNLSLTFLDLSPLYAGTIEYGSIINVINGSVQGKINKDRQQALALERAKNEPFMNLRTAPR